VTQRDEVRGSFGSLNTGDAGDSQNITLFQILVGDGSNRVWTHENLASGHCSALRGLFGANVDHPRLALLIKVR
jgi:hypothetical protein